MSKKRGDETRQRNAASPPQAHPDLPGQVVMVLQGGGALGVYHVGVEGAAFYSTAPLKYAPHCRRR